MFKSLREAKSKAKENKALNENELANILQEGFNLFNEFAKTQDTGNLKLAANKFFMYLKSKRNNPKPYFYISTIFYLFEEQNMAVKYLKAVEEVDPSFKDLPTLRKLLFS